ncbi:hypothetical protein FHX44_112059 [Pseudonocardia hierapolitana]|uniref:Uncharacterized protein n=1 Tax=Pseudonocardia hierapolitana TaxID=1128676 RepID=A0A561SMS7_9PSEU|nr:hypothetical protein [Pseudonocardia hierapolitana]TWF76171.1 hypothetical protein FHX44_112059 [Pseudonocardia hierapolitana]
MTNIVRGRRRSSIVGLALLLGSLAAVVGSAHVIDAAPRPITSVSAADTDPGDPVGLCRITRACWE